MTLEADQNDGCGESVERFATRCAELGAMVWRVGEGGRTRLILADEFSRLFHTRRMIELVSRSSGAPCGEVVELAPDLSLTILSEGGSEKTVTAVMVLGRDFERTALFNECAGEAGLTPAAAGAEIAPLRRYDHDSCEAFVRTAGWMLADLERLAEHHAVIESFSMELMDAYEQIGLLYRLGCAMGSGTPTERFVTDLCEELRQYSRFEWVAAVFTPNGQYTSTVVGGSTATGRSDRHRHTLIRSASELMRELGDARSAILEPGQGGLAGAIKSELAVHTILLDGKPAGALVAGDKAGEDPGVSSKDTQLLKAASEFLSVFLDNARMYEDQRRLFMGTLQALTASIDAKDRYTRGHSERVSHLAVMFSEAIGLDREFVEDIRICGLVHDVGKIGVPESVLQKVGTLTKEEFVLIRQHPEIGHRILRNVPQLANILPGVLHHHERWDGGGYPHGLAGEEIPLIARLLSVADTFDAMSSSRSYREAMPRDVVVKEIQDCAGTQFDPELARAFIDLDFRVYDEMARVHGMQQECAA